MSTSSNTLFNPTDIFSFIRAIDEDNLIGVMRDGTQFSYSYWIWSPSRVMNKPSTGSCIAPKQIILCYNYNYIICAIHHYAILCHWATIIVPRYLCRLILDLKFSTEASIVRASSVILNGDVCKWKDEIFQYILSDLKNTNI